MKKLLAIITLVTLLMSITTMVFAYTPDPTRPSNPPGRPSLIAPYSNSAIEQVCGPGCGNHFDNPAKTTKAYYALDYALIGSNGYYQPFQVRASAGGTVKYYTGSAYLRGGTQAGCPVDADLNTDGMQGMGVFIDHGNGWMTFYFHLASLTLPLPADVKSGDIIGHVNQGDIIGEAGCSGANSLHLHYDLRWHDTSTNIWWTYLPEFGTPSASFAVDVAFVIDTTGSMYDDIAAVKSAASDIVDIIKDATADSRIALIDFRDFPQRTGASYDYPYRDALPFTFDAAKAKNAINSLNLGFGGDGPETRFCALMHAMNDDKCANQGADTSIGPWRPIPNKFIVVLTDASALSPEPYTGFSAFGMINSSHDGGFELFGGEDNYLDNEPPVYGIPIYSVVVGGDAAALEDSIQIADGTGGKVFTAATAQDVADAIMAAVEIIVTPPTPPPTCSSAFPNPGLLWPPDNQLTSVNILGVDNADSIIVSGIHQDEPTNGEQDASGIGTNTVVLRAQRNGKGDGRVYYVNFSATGQGGSCSGLVKIIVPHDMGEGQRERGTAGDGGPLFDSTLP